MSGKRLKTRETFSSDLNSSVHTLLPHWLGRCYPKNSYQFQSGKGRLRKYKSDEYIPDFQQSFRVQDFYFSTVKINKTIAFEFG